MEDRRGFVEEVNEFVEESCCLFEKDDGVSLLQSNVNTGNISTKDGVYQYFSKENLLKVLPLDPSCER